MIFREGAVQAWIPNGEEFIYLIYLNGLLRLTAQRKPLMVTSLDYFKNQKPFYFNILYNTICFILRNFEQLFKRCTKSRLLWPENCTVTYRQRFCEVLVNVVNSILPILQLIGPPGRVRVDPRWQVTFEPSSRTGECRVQV